MIDQIRKELAQYGPLTVGIAQLVAGGDLSLGGDRWTLSSPSAWRIVGGGVLAFGWSDEAAEAGVAELIGLSIVAVEPQSARMTGDPAFELSDGRWIEIFSDQPMDPWVFALPSMVFVGAPADAEHV